MIRKFFSLIIVLIFVPLLFASIFLFSLRNSLLQADFFKNSLQKNQLYQEIVDQGAGYFSSAIGKEGGMKVGKLSPQEFSDLVKQSLSPEWLKTQTENILDEVFSYINKEKNTVVYKIPISELKESLSKNLPKDSQEIQTQLSQLPDEYDLGASWMKKSTLAKLRNFNSISGKLLAIGGGILAFLLLVIILINHKNPRGALKWVFIPSLISSFGVLSAALLGKLVILFALGGFLATFPKELKNIAKLAISATAGQLLNYLALVSGLILLLSILGLISIKILNIKKPLKAA